jgi:hypothetical protein
MTWPYRAATEEHGEGYGDAAAGAQSGRPAGA